MKRPFSIFPLVVGGLSAILPAATAINVTQHHNHDSRDGLYIDPAFTQAAAANLTRDLSFNGTIVGNVYAQPLYVEDGPGGAAMVIAVTESNNVYALDAATGAIIWQRNVGTPITSGLPCGNINPVGITGTPIVDLASRALFFDAEVTPSTGVFKHLIYSLNVDTGAINMGWPVDVGAVVSGFTSSVQGERAALGIVGNIVYVPYGGRSGDCGNYRGRLVGVQMNNPGSVMGWATTAIGGGVWGPGGVASDGTNPFVVTGNTFSTGGTWGEGEAVIRLQPGPIFSGSTNDYWAPTNWLALDNSDTDLGGSGAILVDVPGATPSALVVALGKDGNAYLLNRSNLGGITAPITSSHVGSGAIIQAAASYRTPMSTYVAFRVNSSTLTTFRITATNPPTITSGWSVTGTGRGSPFVTTTDGTSNVIVWIVGAEGDQRLHGHDGDTGNVVFGGGGVNELMAGTQRFNTAIAARGRIYVATNNKVYAFNVPTTSTPTPSPTGPPTPTPTSTPTPTATPPPINISGTTSYCSNPVPGPVPNVTLTLTGTASGSTLSDGSGNYQFSSLASGGSYTVTPTKSALPPGSAGVDTLDVVATQRHFLNLGTPLSGCRLTAADVNADATVNTLDVIAIQRFFLGQTTGIGNTGNYQFNPMNRTYPGVVSNQTSQNYDTLVFGDVATPFAERLDGLSQSAADDRMSVGGVTAQVAAVALPEIAIDKSMTNFPVAVRSSAIDAKNKLVGFQGDFTFDERVITFQEPPVQKAGLTAGNWNVSGNVLPGAGPIRTLRVSAYSNDFAALSGSGTLFELRMTRASQTAQSTPLKWSAPPDHFFFIDADLNTQKPGNAAPGNVTSSGKRQ